jgi:phage terminase large subunit
MHGVDAMILKTTYKDNRFLPKEYGEDLERFKFTSPYDYQVYALGNWGTMGETIFDANKIQLQLDRLAKMNFLKYEFLYSMSDTKLPMRDTYKLIPMTDGDITIFKEPEYKHPYVLGIDTAGEGSDYYAGHVMDNISGEQVAVFHSQKKPDECIWQLLGLAYHYNYALVVPEINFDSWIIKAFQMVDYPELYRRVSQADKTHIRREDKYGWRTDIQTRPMMLSDMVYWTGDFMHCINCVDTLNEMLVFTRQDKKLKGVWMGAEAGEHDDLVISMCITLQGRQQQSCELIPDKKKIQGFWTEEEIEIALENGDIDISQAMEYKETVGYYCQGN